jgi:pimeloyl-ACP methyl ester carboxylesterase
MNTNRKSMKRGFLFWLGRVLLAVPVLLVLLTVTALAAGAKAKQDFEQNYPPLGQMVDMGGYSLHLYCSGESQAGEPTVIVEAGAASVSLMWALVQDGVSKSARICTYDRAGLGWSEPSPRPRTAGVIVDELHNLLVNAGIESPYILVGHSLGGIFVREYQYNYPDEVAGLILVDSGDGDLATYMAGTSYLQTMNQFIDISRTFSGTGLIRVFTGISALFPSEPGYETLPTGIPETIQAMMIKTTEAGTVEVAALPIIWDENRAHKTSLGELPLTVIVHGYCSSCSKDPVELAKEEAAWLAMQESLASLSNNSELIIADPQTGHDVQIDQPGLIIEAILRMLEKK